MKCLEKRTTKPSVIFLTDTSPIFVTLRFTKTPGSIIQRHDKLPSGKHALRTILEDQAQSGSIQSRKRMSTISTVLMRLPNGKLFIVFPSCLNPACCRHYMKSLLGILSRYLTSTQTGDMKPSTI